MSNLELGALKRQLITCTSAKTVRVLLVKLASALAPTNQLLEPWNLNPSWIMPIQIKSVLISLQRSFFQDFAYVLVAKAKDLASRNVNRNRIDLNSNTLTQSYYDIFQEFKLAINLLNTLKTEAQRHENNANITKLSKLIDYEILLFQITQTLDEWPNKQLDRDAMINKCKQCLMAAQNGDNIVPRVEILDACAAMLLNLNEISGLVVTDKRYPSSELYSAIATAIIELEHFKSNGIKKVCREAWDLVLPMFSSNNVGTQGNKRNQSGGGSNALGGSGGPGGGGSNVGGGSSGTGAPNLRDSPMIIVSTNLSPFLKKLRDPLRKRVYYK